MFSITVHWDPGCRYWIATAGDDSETMYHTSGSKISEAMKKMGEAIEEGRFEPAELEPATPRELLASKKKPHPSEQQSIRIKTRTHIEQSRIDEAVDELLVVNGASPNARAFIQRRIKTLLDSVHVSKDGVCQGSDPAGIHVLVGRERQ